MNDSISSRNAVFIIIVINISNNVILGFPPETGQDTWLAILGGMIGVLPLILMYARMNRLKPGQSLFDMAESAFGKWAGRVVSLVFSVYPFILCGLVMHTFSRFIDLTSLFKTPLIVITLLLFMAVLYLGKSSTHTISRLAMIIAIISVTMLILIVCLSMPIMDLKYLLPALANEPSDIAMTAVRVIFVPFGECVILLGLFGDLEARVNPYKVYSLGILVSGLFSITIFLRTCTVLGPEAMASIYFPNYRTASMISIGNFLQRIESVIAFVYILGSIVKAGVCLICAVRGIAKAFNLPSREAIAFPVGFAIVALSSVFYSNMLEIYQVVSLYMYFVFPFQILIPFAIWITLEVRARASCRNLAPRGG